MFFGSLAFMQHFKFVNWSFRFLMSRTGYMKIQKQIPKKSNTLANFQPDAWPAQKTYFFFI